MELTLQIIRRIVQNNVIRYVTDVVPATASMFACIMLIFTVIFQEIFIESAGVSDSHMRLSDEVSWVQLTSDY